MRAPVRGSVPLLALSLALGCGGEESAAIAKKLNETSDKLSACDKEQGRLKEEMGTLKRQLAEAMANPARVQLTDPEIIQLVAEIRAARGPAGGAASPKGGKEGELKLGKGDLDPRAASKIILTGAQAMQACYERALKRNASLQYQAGIGLTVGVTVKPTGAVQEVDIAPAPDREMIACMRSTAMHWKFPPFSGQSVTVEQRFTLSPKQ